MGNLETKPELLAAYHVACRAVEREKERYKLFIEGTLIPSLGIKPGDVAVSDTGYKMVIDRVFVMTGLDGRVKLRGDGVKLKKNGERGVARATATWIITEARKKP